MPSHMNYAAIRIRRLVPGDTPTDQYRRQAVGDPSYATEETFYAQIAEDSRQRRIRNQLGGTLMGEGRLVYEPFADAVRNLKIGDLIVGFPDPAGGWATTDFVVTTVKVESYLNGRPLLHYADYDKNDRVTASR